MKNNSVYLNIYYKTKMIDLMDDINKIALSKKIKPTKLNEETTVIDDNDFRTFIIKLNAAQQYIKSFDLAVCSIQKYRKSMQKSSNANDVNELKRDIENRIDSCKEIQNEIKDIIVSNENFVNECKNEEKYYSRIVSNLYSAILKRFEKIAEKLSNEQNLVSDYIKSTMLREAEMYLDKKLTEEEKEQIIDNPELIKELTQSKLSGQAHEKMVNAVNDLQSRHDEILKLEKNINQVHQMFVDLQVLVKAQGDVIDNIEMNISTAKDCVLDGEVSIAQSYEYLKSARKKKCIVIGIIVVLIIIVLSTVLPLSL